MSIQIEAARKRLYSVYGVDVDKYTNDEVVDELTEKLEGILSFGLIIILPVIICFILFTAASIILSNVFDTALFGTLYFIFSILIFIGTGLLSLSIAIKNLYEGIGYILAYATNVTNDIRKGITNELKASLNYKDLTLLVLYGIVFPVVKKIVRKSLIGGLLYYIIEKVVNRGIKDLPPDGLDKSSGDSTYNENEKSGLLTVSSAIKSLSKSLLTSIILVAKIFGIVFICLGFILNIVLVLIFL